jgi:hypothetical protein
VALELADRGDLAEAFIAKRIIELAKAGEGNPDILCERALKEMRLFLTRVAQTPPLRVILDVRT